MQPDRYMKVVLTVIAACLVWICLRDITVVKPAHAQAQGNLRMIEHDLHRIYNGNCKNSKIC